MSMPEPKTFNGEPGETGGYASRNTGPRREPPALCYWCGEEIEDGARCDRRACQERAVTTEQKASA